MHAWLRAIRVGDRCRIETTTFQVVGTLACLQPDGNFWQEWLLVPRGENPTVALDAGNARWLALEEDIGALLWRPIELPSGIVPGELDGLRSFEHKGRTYRRLERDAFQVARIEGDLGGDSTAGERVQYADFLSNERRLSVEWNERGVWCYKGHRVTPMEVKNWFTAEGVALNVRAVRPTKTTSLSTTRYDADARDAHEWIVSLVVLAIFIPFLLIDGCSQNCNRPVTNPQTGQTEYACPDGSVRSSRGWHGK